MQPIIESACAYLCNEAPDSSRSSGHLTHITGTLWPLAQEKALSISTADDKTQARATTSAPLLISGNV